MNGIVIKERLANGATRLSLLLLALLMSFSIGCTDSVENEKKGETLDVEE